MSGPDFDELVGPEVPAAERERLRRAHEALLAAGPPPELSPAISAPPRVEPPGRLLILPRRRRFATALVAASVAAAVFLAAFLIGRSSSPGDPFRLVRGPVAMHGTALAQGASASIAIGPKDASGNWPMVMHVRGLPPLPRGREYELFLSRKGVPIDLCTSFRVHSGQTDVWFNAPYELKRYDGWVVIVRPAGASQEPPVVMTT